MECIFNSVIEHLRNLLLGLFFVGFLMSLHFLIRKYIDKALPDNESEEGIVEIPLFEPLFFGAIITIIGLIYLTMRDIILPCIK